MTAKYALLIGINYKADASNELHGCVNDIYAIKDYLLSKRNYSASDVVWMPIEMPFFLSSHNSC